MIEERQRLTLIVKNVYDKLNIDFLCFLKC